MTVCLWCCQERAFHVGSYDRYTVVYDIYYVAIYGSYAQIEAARKFHESDVTGILRSSQRLKVL